MSNDFLVSYAMISVFYLFLLCLLFFTLREFLAKYLILKRKSVDQEEQQLSWRGKEYRQKELSLHIRQKEYELDELVYHEEIAAAKANEQWGDK